MWLESGMTYGLWYNDKSLCERERERERERDAGA